MAIAVEDVICTKRDDMPARQHMVRATLHQPADIEVIGIQEARNRNPKNILGAKFLSEDFGEELVGGRRRRREGERERRGEQR
jgi:hypothetical protein